MAFNPLQDPIQQWAEQASLWLNRFMRDDGFVKGILVEPAGIGADGERHPQPRVLFAVRRPHDASAYLTSILQVRPLPQSATVHFVERLPPVVYGGFFQDLFGPKDSASVAARIEARGKADAARIASESLAAQSRADARDQRIRDIGSRDAGWITAQGDAMQTRRTAWYDTTTKAIAQTRADRRARRAEQSEADYKLAEEARARAEAHRRASRDARARARIAMRTDVGQRAQDALKEQQRIRLEGQNARREARITDATDRVTDRITGREARLKARREEALSNEQGWLDLLLGGQKARGTAWQTALTEGVREAVTGRKERQVLRTDAQVARRSETARRHALMAKAGRGWGPEEVPSAPTAPPEAPQTESVSGLHGTLDSYGANEADFDPKALVLRTMEKTKKGTLPPPDTWTRGLTGSALTLGEELTEWVVDHVVSPVQAGTWDAVVLAGAAASKGEIEGALRRADLADRAEVSMAIERVLA